MLKALPTSFKSNLKNHNKLTFVYNNTKHQNANYLSYVFLFGRNGCLPLDLMFDINTNNDIKNKPHSGYAQNQKNVVKEVYSKICHNNFYKKNSRSNYDIFGSTLNPEEGVLFKKLLQRRGTGKLRSYWENDIYEIVSCRPKSPIYQIVPECSENAIQTVNWNLLMRYSHVPFETQSSYSTFSTTNQEKYSNSKYKN